MYTQCPECQTVFRVGAPQLRAAAGKVRCGRCSTVFNALDHPAGEDGTERPASLIGAGAAAPLPEERIAAGGGEWDPLSEQGLESLLQPAETGNGGSGDEGADGSGRYEAFDDLEFGFRTKAPPAPPAPRPAPAQVEGVATEPRQAPPPAPRGKGPEAPAREARDTATPARAPAAPARAGKPPRGKAPGAEDALPLQLEQRRGRSRAGATLLWSLLVLLLVAAGAGQYAYFHRDTLARYDELRPHLERLCEVLGCELPARRDLAAIELTDHAVQSHPEKDGALLITATLLNSAEFPQPYPDVEVVMMDIEQRPVAARRFTPAEYLAEQPEATALFPAGRDANLLLEVVDPGPEAVSFEFLFH